MVILDPVKYWECKACGIEHTTHVYSAPNNIPMHNCPAMNNMSLPLTVKGEKTNMKLQEREEYVGKTKGLSYVDGKPVMAVVTEKDDGSNDTHVYPGTAELDTQNRQIS